MDILLNIGILAFIGIFAAFILRKFKIPDVLSYIIVGAILGDSLLKFIPASLEKWGETITSIALGYIAFIIGETFRWKNIVEIGKNGIIVTVIQAVVTTVVVFLGFFALTSLKIIRVDYPMALSLILAVTATATAPAATFMVLRQYGARGPLTNYLLLAVTLDDAIGIIFFDISVVIVKAILQGGHVYISEALLVALKEISLSIIFGFVLGALLTFLLRFLKTKDELLILPLSFVLIGIGISRQFNLSPLLLNMVLGTTLVNFSNREREVFPTVTNWLPPLFLIFFILSGSTLDFRLIVKGSIIIIVYIILRTAGKVLGCQYGAKLANAPVNVQKYLGWAMLNQAGVAIGFAVFIKNLFPQLAYINTIVLAAIGVFGIMGPIGAKIAVFKAKEATIIEK
ncbi:MAG: cation:proton antiporter [Caldisericaceae bacterium]